jgi:hypothetical protein
MFKPLNLPPRPFSGVICAVFSTVLLLLLAGCDGNLTSDVSQLKNLAEQISKEVEPYATSISGKAEKQISSIISFDYHVYELPAGTTSQDLEQSLKNKGQEKWDCFSIHYLAGGEIRITCRKIPYDYLKLLL